MQQIQTLAHEVGHAEYAGKVDNTSKQKYIDSNLADEGAATLNNIKLQRELRAAGGPDVGIAGNPANQPAYNAAYDQYEKDGDGARPESRLGLRSVRARHRPFKSMASTSTTTTTTARATRGRNPNAWLVVAVLVAACGQIQGPDARARSMQNTPMTLWQVIANVGGQMPLSKAKLESVLAAKLELKERTEYLSHWIGGRVELADDVQVSAINLVLDPADNFDDSSGATLELTGRCIGLAEVRARYSPLALTDVPRGRSLEELTIHTILERWGKLSFSFKEARKDCLFAVIFDGAP